MLKFLFSILLLANVGLFAYQRGYFDAWVDDGHEPKRLSRQFNADKINIVSSGTPAAPTALASGTAPASSSATAAITDARLAAAQPAPAAPAASAAPAPAAPSVSAEKPATAVCTEIGNFDAAEAKRFALRLDALGLGDKLSRREIQEATHNMVYIPSLGSKDAVDKKAGELRHLGVTDFYVIQEAGDLHWAISLGIFKTEEAAKAHLAALMQKGVHSARLGARNNVLNKIAFQLRSLDPATTSGIEKIKLEFPHQETRACDTAAAQAEVKKPTEKVVAVAAAAVPAKPVRPAEKPVAATPAAVVPQAQAPEEQAAPHQ